MNGDKMDTTDGGMRHFQSATEHNNIRMMSAEQCLV